MRTLFKGQIDASVILPVLIGLLYAGTGSWTAERWNGALAIMNLGAAMKVGYERGYNTFNPELHREPYSLPHGPEHERLIQLEDHQAAERLRDGPGHLAGADARDH
jgi:hypothetical protein